MKHKQDITLEQWACKAKRILEDAFHKDAIWTPTLELFISECPANPTNPVANNDDIPSEQRYGFSPK